ncbi:hypothetical protein AB832_05290 [Flavobacteriaceae bacterium (ex Bugula neritina AB1)]|nr:hypothetical protein AB832_05290 [Flavobacteriaceae bacterium (ex Bugula neritina AB1)]
MLMLKPSAFFIRKNQIKTHRNMNTSNYKPQVVKRYMKIEKITYRKYHIKDFNVIVKLLYPYRQTVNKYEKLLQQMNFTDKQQSMIKETAHSLTIINEVYREQDSYARFYVTREDIINAIYMLQNELHLQQQEYILSPTLRWFYNQLQMHFTSTAFTVREVRYKLRKSDSLCRRYIVELIERELVETVGKRGTSHVHQLIHTATI